MANNFSRYNNFISLDTATEEFLDFSTDKFHLISGNLG